MPIFKKLIFEYLNFIGITKILWSVKRLKRVTSPQLKIGCVLCFNVHMIHTKWQFHESSNSHLHQSKYCKRFHARLMDKCIQTNFKHEWNYRIFSQNEVTVSSRTPPHTATPTRRYSMTKTFERNWLVYMVSPFLFKHRLEIFILSIQLYFETFWNLLKVCTQT